ncbi:hypothetical protein KUTeg_012293 [Tegillarca granosa]|uniref:EF-hand domain-containing protein n=1 Tax=Tegillarca granosa TaxID=220873 RepID=A0ABQ9EZ47_TEGGR|nr:hypothetical protein KUTeg_012293 [Tegillarca granosa]
MDRNRKRLGLNDILLMFNNQWLLYLICSFKIHAMKTRISTCVTVLTVLMLSLIHSGVYSLNIGKLLAGRSFQGLEKLRKRNGEEPRRHKQASFVLFSHLDISVTYSMKVNVLITRSNFIICPNSFSDITRPCFELPQLQGKYYVPLNQSKRIVLQATLKNSSIGCPWKAQFSTFIDQNNDGKASESEVRSYLQKYNPDVTDEQIRDFLIRRDTDGNYVNVKKWILSILNRTLI